MYCWIQNGFSSEHNEILDFTSLLSLISSVCIRISAIKRQRVWRPAQDLYAPSGQRTPTHSCILLTHTPPPRGQSADFLPLSRSTARVWAWSSSWRSRPYRWSVTKQIDTSDSAFKLTSDLFMLLYHGCPSPRGWRVRNSIINHSVAAACLHWTGKIPSSSSVRSPCGRGL